MSNLTVIRGYVPMEHVDARTLIAHVTNNTRERVWGGGFTAALDKKVPGIGRHFRHGDDHGHHLGETQFVVGENWIAVANMCAQSGFPSPSRPCALDYAALRECLEDVKHFVAKEGLDTVHMPRIGSGIAGGDWAVVEDLILEVLAPYVQVKIYIP